MGTVQPSYAQEDTVFIALVREESVNEEQMLRNSELLP